MACAEEVAYTVEVRVVAVRVVVVVVTVEMDVNVTGSGTSTGNWRALEQLSSDSCACANAALVALCSYRARIAIRLGIIHSTIPTILQLLLVGVCLGSVSVDIMRVRWG